MLLIVFIEMLFSSAWLGQVARGIEWVRVRCGKRIPVGSYHFETEIGVGFGVDDTTLILRLPVMDLGAEHPTRYIGVTDSSTRFTVNGNDAIPDAFLEAYDDSLGPLDIQVCVRGRIAGIGIADDARRPTRAST